jgi:hypothetical protein
MHKKINDLASTTASGLTQHRTRKEFALAHWDEMMFEHQALPVAANTITSVLQNFLVDSAITDLVNMWGPLQAFTLPFDPNPIAPLSPAVIKHVTTGSTAQTNPTNYESGNGTIVPVTSTPSEYSISWQISNTDLNSGVRINNLAAINTANFANIVTEAANAVITTGNFGTATVISAAAAFGFSDLATLQAALKKSPIKNLILDGAYIARIANSPTFLQKVGAGPNAWQAYGWNGIHSQSDWTGATANTVGFACNPQAISGIWGQPALPAFIPGGILASNVIQVPGLEARVLAELWFNPASRTTWSSLRTIASFSKMDASAGFLVASA